MVVSVRTALALKITAGVLAVSALVLMASGLYLYRLSLTLPDLSSGPDAVRTARTSIVYAADGSVIAQWHAGEDRTVVELASIPQAMRDATVAAEDERFYEHHGVDIDAMLRSLGFDVGNRNGLSGSTITQQLVKMLFPEEKRTFARKVKEVMLAYELDVRTDKNEVLEAYLNTVYFGHGAYGIETASRRYFGVSATDLSVGQAALLAGLIRSPGRYSPVDEPDAALSRRNEVLARMCDAGYISRPVEREAAEAEIVLAPPSDAPEVAPYFVEYVKRSLIDELGTDAVFTGGLRVYTTLEPGIQYEAERAARAALGQATDPEYAVVALEHATGRVLALVGGRDYSQNQFNLAVQGRRQPGSAFKPFVLARALEEGVSPDRVYDATPYTVQVDDGIWKVNNYENDLTASSLTLRAATNWSVNAVYARLIMQVGAEDVVDVARRMGITSEVEANPAIALGGMAQGVSPLEMASAYGTFANGGLRVAPVAITRVTDDSGETLYEPPPSSERAIEESVATRTSLMLHDAVEAGTGVAARIPGTWVAGKTGTTQSYRDAWFVGYTKDISCAVWVGHREGQVAMTDVHGIQVTGGSYPARIWSDFISDAILLRRSPVMPALPFDPVGSGAGEAEGAAMVSAVNLMPVEMCPDSVRIAHAGCPSPVKMYFEAATGPLAVCAKH
ncbi:MAG: transglycosylase domain-containing protein [Coriobacteriia bacterium]|nr:transglycosylase domain-containing protein [Coriobacteriia bacterium]